MLTLFAMTGLAARPAQALPAFAAQTGQPCQMCHVGGFGPQLTPYGRNFKIHGYTQRANGFTIPFSAMAEGSFVHTAKDQAPPAHYAPNNNTTLDQISLFFAGGFGQHLGAFVQATWDGVARAFTWDNLDVRTVTSVKLGTHDVALGASLNNNPTLTDPWNTLSAWGFPYTGSNLAPSPSASPLLNGAFAQTSLGATAYAWIDNAFYVEGGAYGSPGATSLRRLGSDPTVPGDIDGLAPYGRIAYQRASGGGTVQIGAFVMDESIHPGLDRATGQTDHYTDAGLDGSYYRVLPNKDVITFNARYMREQQALHASCTLAGGDANCARNHLNDVRADVSYYWRNKIGGTIQVFNTTGNTNRFLFPANRTFRPDTTGLLLQLDGTPFGDQPQPARRANLRMGVQYTLYTSFNGAATNFDGAGAKASDNNTVRLFTWFAF
ncbi:MAG TPA: hypothetical protein VHZ26_16690 [Caulobacteraceae bacterium]|nr:hypothetical protein [Caulobacteraceae bacterium]